MSKTAELAHLFRALKAPAAARALRERRGKPDDGIVVEQRPLSVYDQLIA